MLKALAIVVGATTIAVVLSSREALSGVDDEAAAITEVPLPL